MTKIIVVEDSPTQALRLKLILEREGLEVSVAPNGREGEAMVSQQPPDAVVLDLNLPDIDGFEVCRALKASPDTASIPIVMLTIKDRAGDTLAGLDAGADAYIPKDDYAEFNLIQVLRDLSVLS